MPDEIVDKYNLKRFEHDGWVYIKIVSSVATRPQLLLAPRLDEGYYMQYECICVAKNLAS